MSNFNDTYFRVIKVTILKATHYNIRSVDGEN